MALYKVYFEGFEYVEADDIEAAQDLCFQGCGIYVEMEVTSAEEVDECVVEL